MNTTMTAKQRSQFLKQLREEHRETAERVQARLKEQKVIRRKIAEALGDQAKTVPEIAAASDLPAKQVLWHLIALKKYNLVIETGQSGEYYLYQLVKEVKA